MYIVYVYYYDKSRGPPFFCGISPGVRYGCEFRAAGTFPTGQRTKVAGGEAQPLPVAARTSTGGCDFHGWKHGWISFW